MLSRSDALYKEGYIALSVYRSKIGARMIRVLFIVAIMGISPVSFTDVARDPLLLKLAAAAKARTLHDVRYDGAYFSISYPNGDVPPNIGVCTDLVIRSYRAVGIDLQKKVHEDMRSNFDQYPSKRIWGLTRPDRNIDHRRVPNLRRYFERLGESLEITANTKEYLPGDIVTWTLPGNLPHIGIVADEMSSDGKRPLIVHNIGQGPKIDDMLFNYKITGHYRYTGSFQ